MDNTDNYQNQFFDSLKKHLPANINLSSTVAEILGISLNEAYKKIRGMSALSFQQMAILCNNLNYVYCFQTKNTEIISFTMPKLEGGTSTLVSYLTDLIVNIESISKLKNKHIKLTTDDIPLFYFFKYQELTAFKLFFWTDSINSNNNTFNNFELDNEVIELTQKLNKLYLEIPSTEIWAKDTVHGTIEQIKYAFDAGYLPNKPLTIKILEQLRQCLTDINMYAVSKKKTLNDNHSFSWYLCDVLGSTCYLVDAEGEIICFNRFNTFGYLKTQHTEYCKQTGQWIEGLIGKSTSLSGHGEKQRNKYLYDSYVEIDQLIYNINKAE